MNIGIFLMMMLPALMAAVVTATNAKKTNAAWRERRVAKLTSRP